MKKTLRTLSLLIITTGLFGCAASTGTLRTTQTEPNPEVSNVIELECNSANRLGCRYKGNLYPWNAWVEAKGYNSRQYAVKDVIQSGNKAVVLVVKR